jgi:hypothetical protein
MQIGDVMTLKIKKDGTAYSKVLEIEWLKLLGYTDKEITSEEIEIRVMASHSKKHNQDYIALFKPK